MDRRPHTTHKYTYIDYKITNHPNNINENMKHIAYTIISAAILMSTASSCDEDNFITPMAYDSTQCFSTVTDKATGQTTVSAGPSYGISYNYTKNTVSVTITGLTLGQEQKPEMTLSDLPWKYDDNGWKTTNVHSKTSGDTTFDSFQISILDRTANIGGHPAHTPVIWITYTIDSRYTVSTYPRELYFFPQEDAGFTTKITSPDGSVFTNSDMYYQASIDPATSTMSLKLYQARFAANMPRPMDMVFKDLPCTFNGAEIRAAANAVTPEIGDTPWPQFPITALRCAMTVYSNMDLGFNCNAMGTPYSVEAKTTCNPK